MTSSYLGAWSETHIFGFAAGLDNLSLMYDTVICAGFGSIDQCHSEVKSKRERDGNAEQNVRGVVQKLIPRSYCRSSSQIGKIQTASGSFSGSSPPP